MLKMPPQTAGLLQRQVPTTPWPLLLAGSTCGPGPAGSDQAQGWKCPRRCWLPVWTWGAGVRRRWLHWRPPQTPRVFSEGGGALAPTLGAEPEMPKEHASRAWGGQLPARLPGPAYRVIVPHGALPTAGAEPGNAGPPAARPRGETSLRQIPEPGKRPAGYPGAEGGPRLPTTPPPGSMSQGTRGPGLCRPRGRGSERDGDQLPPRLHEGHGGCVSTAFGHNRM